MAMAEISFSRAAEIFNITITEMRVLARKWHEEYGERDDSGRKYIRNDLEHMEDGKKERRISDETGLFEADED